MRSLFINIYGAFLLVLVISGCTPTVSPENVYHADATDSELGSAKNIVVEQTPDGVKVSGSEVSLLALITKSSFEIQTEPAGAELEYTVGGVEFDNRLGALIAKVNVNLGTDSAVPARLPVEGSTGFAPALYGFVPGALGSQNVSVKINPAVGHTDIAGLQFKQEAVLSIREDGTVEVNKAGIVASDAAGNEWISQKAKLGGTIAVIMVRKN